MVGRPEPNARSRSSSMAFASEARPGERFGGRGSLGRWWSASARAEGETALGGTRRSRPAPLQTWGAVAWPWQAGVQRAGCWRRCPRRPAGARGVPPGAAPGASGPGAPAGSCSASTRQLLEGVLPQCSRRRRRRRVRLRAAAGTGGAGRFRARRRGAGVLPDRLVARVVQVVVVLRAHRPDRVQGGCPGHHPAACGYGRP